MRTPKKLNNRNVVLLVFFSVLVIFISIRMAAINSKFFVYLAVVFCLVPIFYFGGKLFSITIAKKCSKCRGPMSNMGVSAVFTGAVDKDGGPNFPSLGKRIFRCLDCENEYHELVYYANDGGDIADHKRYIKFDLEVAKSMFGSELPQNTKQVGIRTLTKAQFLKIKKQLIDEVTQNNIKAGFSGNFIKIEEE